jgi:hypothetical protein
MRELLLLYLLATSNEVHARRNGVALPVPKVQHKHLKPSKVRCVNPYVKKKTKRFKDMHHGQRPM